MFLSHSTPTWPPIRRRTEGNIKENLLPFPATPTPATQPTLSSYVLLTAPEDTPTTPRSPLVEKKNRTRYQNGYEVKPKTPSFKPYTINNPGHARQKVFAFNSFTPLAPIKPLSPEVWNQLARDSGLLKSGQRLRDYQVEAANFILSREGDLCVVAPTGAGKSHIWVLPLLAQRAGISLVIIPFTSLGYQGEERYAIREYDASIFLNMGSLLVTVKVV